MSQRQQNETLLNQRACVVWFTGLPAAGKTTLALSVGNKLASMRYLYHVLDADHVRQGLTYGLGFSPADRTENIRRVSHAARLFLDTGIITLCCFISPLQSMRNMARSIIGNDDFIEVYLSTPIEVCEKRDPKGLYVRARQGTLVQFTGVSDPYEPPLNPDITIDASLLSVEQSASIVFNYLIPRIRYA